MKSTVNTNSNKIQLLRVFSSRPLLSYQEDKRLFVPFRDEINQIVLAIDTYENALVIGERGGGKSTLLNHIFYKYMNNESTLLIKLNALSFETFDQQNLILKIIKELLEKSTPSTSGPLSLLHEYFNSIHSNNKKIFQIESKDVSSLLEQFEKIIEYLKENQIMVCIIIDDADKIGAGLIWQTFRNIRDQIWKLKISIILSVLPNQVSEITKPPLDHFFAYGIKLPVLDRASSYELIRRRIDSTNSSLDIDDVSINEILHRTNGNPLAIIEVVKQILEEKKDVNHISKKDIEKMGISFLNQLSDVDRSVCNYLLEKGGASASDSIFAKQIGVSRSRLSQILNKLRKKGIVSFKKEGRSTTYFVTESGLKHRDDVETSSQQNMLRQLTDGNVREFNKIRSENDYQKIDLKGRDLKNANLSDVNLSGADLKNANLSGADLKNANLSGADLKNANLSGADLKNANLSGANLSGALLVEVDLYGADLSDCLLDEANLNRANMSHSNLARSHLIHATLNRANLSGIYLYGANLLGAELIEVDLEGANLNNASLKNVNLVVSNLKNANLSGADLKNANLSKTRHLPISKKEAITRGAIIRLIPE